MKHRLHFITTLRDNELDLWNRAEKLGWNGADIFRLGLLAFTKYATMSALMEKQLGGVLATGRVAFNKKAKCYKMFDDSRGKAPRSWITCEGPGQFGFSDGRPLLSKDKQTRHFAIQKRREDGRFDCVFTDGDKAGFILAAPLYLISKTLKARMVEAGILSEEVKDVE